jgi:hypothetical protein
MRAEPNELEKQLASKFAALVKAGHDPEQIALAALDMACGALSAARGPLATRNHSPRAGQHGASPTWGLRALNPAELGLKHSHGGAGVASAGGGRSSTAQRTRDSLKPKSNYC